MSRGLRRQTPALLVGCIALVGALGGTVYAAGKINGKTIKVKSLPGNRLAPRSVPGNRLRPGAITGRMLGPGSVPATALAPGSITGIQIDASTLDSVPSAVHADNADSARDAQTALNAVNAISATKVNGHTAGCAEKTRFFAGACWAENRSSAAVSAPAAAHSCATNGGELPSALALAEFSQQPGIKLAPGDEWSGDITALSGPGVYAVVTVSSSSQVKSAPSTEAREYRCVVPLVR